MSLSGRDISCKELRSRRHSVFATSVTKKEGRGISYKERRSRHHSAVTTSNPRDAKGKSRPNKSSCDIAETTEVATKNRGRDINNQMGQLT